MIFLSLSRENNILKLNYPPKNNCYNSIYKIFCFFSWKWLTYCTTMSQDYLNCLLTSLRLLWSLRPLGVVEAVEFPTVLTSPSCPCQNSDIVQRKRRGIHVRHSQFEVCCLWSSDRAFRSLLVGLWLSEKVIQNHYIIVYKKINWLDVFLREIEILISLQWENSWLVEYK